MTDGPLAPKIDSVEQSLGTAVEQTAVLLSNLRLHGLATLFHRRSPPPALDALEHEAVERGGVQPLLADHFAKVYKLRLPLASAV